MRKLLLALGLAITAFAVKRSGDGADDDPATTPGGTGRGAAAVLPAGAAGSARAAGRPPSARPRGGRVDEEEIDVTDDAMDRQARQQDDRGNHDDRGHQADSPTEIPKSGWKDIAKRTLGEVKADKVPMMAAAVAFAGLLALFPAMIAGISIFGLVVDQQTVADRAQELTSTLPEGAASLITDQLGDIAGSEPGTLGVALVVSVLAALWSASGGMNMLIMALNTAYDEEDERGFVKKRGLAILLTLGALVFIAVTVGLIAVVPPVLDNLGLGVVGTIAAQAARWVLLAVLIAAALAVLYRFGPDRDDARWSWISPGAVVAGVLWLLGSIAFSFFVSNFGSYNETYGTVSGVIVLMLWLQISALVVLLGAELNGEMERQTLHDTTTGAPEPLGQRGAEPADDVPPAPGEDATSDGIDADRDAVRT